MREGSAARTHTGVHAADLDFCHDEEWMTFGDYQSWIKLTEEPVISYAHGENWIDIYANELAAQPYQNLASAYPECAAVVKAASTAACSTLRRLAGWLCSPRWISWISTICAERAALR